jgi:hypothetical protein
LEGNRRILEARIAAMRGEFAVQELASRKVTDVQQAIEIVAAEQRKKMAHARRADITSNPVARRANPRKST